ncbi:PREDICTED: tetraspanin-31-like [Branchiostoma belcheri]|uniref:Tetraspanin-31-like n=1 Tax=Branchiostoma belcheri TaxID=7741 RepID=A0A6P4YK28_BRABE|nr:PREDICTED: tetraspanin-31-like [Branchiostoma belcheri]
MCGGFHCSKNALAALNILYILVAFIMIGVAAYGRAMAMVTSVSLIGGIIASGVFLLFIAIIGLIGAVKHHQVLLFFYMVILFLLFIIQFSISCACLAFSTTYKEQLLTFGWKHSATATRADTQKAFNCCGLYNTTSADPKDPGCTGLPCDNGAPGCPSCMQKLLPTIGTALRVSGGVGLFFSFTEIVGVWLAVRFRNQKDPRANPSAFL